MNRKYLKITNKDGKVWLMPKRHMKTGLELYQPSSKKGLLLKRWLPWVYWLKPLMGKLGMSDIEYVMDPQIHHIIERKFNQNAVEYSVFEGTPCVHQKTTIQIFKGENILGYCKVTKNLELYGIFQHEQKLLGWLHEKGVGQIPECPYCGKTEDGNRLVPLFGKGGGEEPGMPMKLSTGTPGVNLAWKAAYCLSCMANSRS